MTLTRPDDAELFRGRVAMVTGAAQGIGRSIAIGLAEMGCRVAVVDREPAGNQETARAVVAWGGEAAAIDADVGEWEEVRRAVDDIAEHFGPVEILVNNAGDFARTHLFDGDPDRAIENYDRQWRSNTRGSFLCALAVVPGMVEVGGGAVLNILTNHVKKGWKLSRQGAAVQGELSGYDGSKWAQLSHTETWAVELAPLNIRVNGLCMASTDTPMLRREVTLPAYWEVALRPEDVALAAVNILRWGPGGPVGWSPMIETRAEAEALMEPPEYATADEPQRALVQTEFVSEPTNLALRDFWLNKTGSVPGADR